MKLVHMFWSPVTILGCILTLSNRGESVKIKEIQVPDFVQNGTTLPVVLDCDYTLDDNEDPRGLTVKWFFDEHPTPVYQWAYGYKPQASGQLSGRVNLEYRASTEGIKANRSIHIINPTYDLSGNYRCQIATFQNEESRNKNMTIYVPVKKMALAVVKPEDDRVNVTCNAEGLYPTPEMTILISEKQFHEVDSIKHDAITITNNTNGVYDISTTITIGDDALPSPTIFECELRIPGTNYTLKQSETYYPGPPSTTTLKTPRRRYKGEVDFHASGSATIPSVGRSLWIVALSIYMASLRL